MLITGNGLKDLVKNKVIDNLISEDQINAASIDITMGDTVLTEPQNGLPITVRLQDRDAIPFNENNINGGNVVLAPGEFILVQSNEVFNLPEDVSAVYKLKSSMARMGLDALNAGWCDAGWNGSVLTIALKNVTNRTNIVLDHNVKFGQMVFFKHDKVGKDLSYAQKGNYNGSNKVTASKPEVKQEVKQVVQTKK